MTEKLFFSFYRKLLSHLVSVSLWRAGQRWSTTISGSPWYYSIIVWGEIVFFSRPNPNKNSNIFFTSYYICICVIFVYVLYLYLPYICICPCCFGTLRLTNVVPWHQARASHELASLCDSMGIRLTRQNYANLYTSETYQKRWFM